jgi:hypothetical protein
LLPAHRCRTKGKPAVQLGSKQFVLVMLVWGVECIGETAPHMVMKGGINHVGVRALVKTQKRRCASLAQGCHGYRGDNNHEAAGWKNIRSRRQGVACRCSGVRPSNAGLRLVAKTCSLGDAKNEA